MRSPQDCIGNVLVCDDIRREVNGKLILIGIYSDSIIVGAFPAALKLRYYVEYLLNESTQTELHFRISTNGVSPAASIDASIEVEGIATVAALDLPPTTITFKEPTTLELSFSLDGETWAAISTKRVLQGEVPGGSTVEVVRRPN